jgi:peptide/nickel transport system permease protein
MLPTGGAQETWQMWITRIARHFAAFMLTTLIAGLLGATLVRFGPGFDADEQQLDPRLGAQSIQAIHESHAAERNLPSFYLHYMEHMATGDLGFSRSLDRPVTQLLAERAAVTLRLMVAGIFGGWVLGLVLAVPAAALRAPLYDLASTAFSGVFLCVPAAVLALLLFFTNGPVHFAIALLIFPKVFRYARNLLVDAYAQPHVLAARARGLGGPGIFFRHVMPQAAPQLLALAGVSLGMAFGAAIPIEVLCDFPGIGQLAWKAALARDLPVLVSITILVAAATQLTNSASDLVVAACSRERV